MGGKPESFPTDSVSIVELIQNTSDKIYAHVFGGSSNGESSSEEKYTKWLACFENAGEASYELWDDGGYELTNSSILLSLTIFGDTVSTNYFIFEFKNPKTDVLVKHYLNTKLICNYKHRTALDIILNSLNQGENYNGTSHLCWSVHSPIID